MPMLSTHRLGSPRTQNAQAPQGGHGVSTTGSPGASPLTPSPTDATTPAASWPSTMGSGLGKVPSAMLRSEWQIPQWATRTRT